MKGFWVVIFLASVASPSFAQQSAEASECFKSAMSQLAMNQCASEEAHREDALLDRTYQKLLALQKSDPVATAKTKNAERAWIAYRDAYIAATYPHENKQAEYGTAYPMEVDELYADLTRLQIKAINDLIRAYTGH